jgi:hypothetical protein
MFKININGQQLTEAQSNALTLAISCAHLYVGSDPVDKKLQDLQRELAEIMTIIRGVTPRIIPRPHPLPDVRTRIPKKDKS